MATTPRLPTGINVPLLRAVKRAILEEPRRLNMSLAIKRKTTGRNAPSCGTVGCIAGWAVLLDAQQHAPRKKIAAIAKQLDKSWGQVEPTAKELLRLNDSQASRLFYSCHWPRADRRALYDKAQDQITNFVRDYKAAARITARRIDKFIRTKGCS